MRVQQGDGTQQCCQLAQSFRVGFEISSGPNGSVDASALCERQLVKPILVIYATREGHTRHVAEHVGAKLDELNRSFVLVDAAHVPHDFSMRDYSGAIVGASLHAGKHEPEMVNSTPLKPLLRGGAPWFFP
jgi:hypothetical protein